jgi:group II intron reverse transcriptase/maturase
MRNAETVLTVIQERGKKGLPLEDIYRQLYNPDLYLQAYARLYHNKGAMTPGSTDETVDGMSLAKIDKLISQLRQERYRWTPVRRTYISKKSNPSKKRPLGLPTWSDKLLQEVMRTILEAYYEPQFSDHSHGFRPGRGCHTALREIKRVWTGTKWFIEADITGCFDNLDHTVMMQILGEKLHDNRFLRLIENLLKAGYLEEWRYHETLSGTPQGGVISPILANIYLDRLDQFVEKVLIPENTKGKKRRWSNPYAVIERRMLKMKKRKKLKEAHQLEKQLQQMPSLDFNDPNYRRLRYIRYADDFLLGFIGSRAEAEEIETHLAEFLKEQLKLELSPQKTVITQATAKPAKFLGYEILNQQNNSRHDWRGQRSANGRIGLLLPAEVVKKKCGLYMKYSHTIPRPELLADDDYSIVQRYQAEYRGIVNYYLPALNVFWLHKLKWVMETSLLKTLAKKHKTTESKVASQLKTMVDTPYGPMKCLEVRVERGEGKKLLVARFGGIPLRQQPIGPLDDKDLSRTIRFGRSEIIQRLLADKCELCGSTEDVEVHHIRKLADLQVKGQKEKSLWAQNMAARRRKTLVVCRKCHMAIHAGKPINHKLEV